MSPSEGELREVRVISIGSRGDGFGRDDAGHAWFISGAVPGDTVQIRVVLDARDRPRAELVRVLEPAPERVDPGCPQDPRCPGCALRTLSLEAQREHKLASWLRVLEKTAPEIARTLSSPVPAARADGYRSRCVAHVLRDPDGALTLGMSSRHGAPIDLTRCPVQTEAVRGLLAAVRAQLEAHPGWAEALRYVVVEAPRPGRGARVGLIASRESPALSSLAAAIPGDASLSVLVGVEPPESHAVELAELTCVRGEGWIEPEIPEGHLRQSPGAWYSNAPHNAARVREVVLEAADALLEARGHRRFEGVVEVGCGIGTHAFALAARAKRYAGIDRDRVAIADAQAVAEALTPEGVEVLFRVGRGARALRRLLILGWSAELVVLHGMRRPFHRQINTAIAALGAARVIVVAPTVGALAGNLERLEAGGYQLLQVTPIDTMPHTAHMMAVAVLERSPG